MHVNEENPPHEVEARPESVIESIEPAKELVVKMERLLNRHADYAEAAEPGS